MSKKESQKEATNAATDAIEAAKEAVNQNISSVVGNEISLDQEDSEDAKFTLVSGVPLKTYNGSTVKTKGILDKTGTVLAVAVARPGSPEFVNRGGMNPSRTLMYGDVALYSFDKKDNKIGMCIISTKSWLIMQSKSVDNKEQSPFIRTPWSVRVNTQGSQQNNGVQPPQLETAVKQLCDIAINIAAKDCFDRIVDGKSSHEQEGYSTALKASTAIADVLAKRRNSSPAQSSQTSSFSSEGLSAQAADLLS